MSYHTVLLLHAYHTIRRFYTLFVLLKIEKCKINLKNVKKQLPLRSNSSARHVYGFLFSFLCYICGAVGTERRVPRAGLPEEGGARGAAVHGRRRAGAAAGRAAGQVRAAAGARQRQPHYRPH